MKSQKVRILGIAKSNMLSLAQKVAPLNTKVIALDDYSTKEKRTDAILVMSKDGNSNMSSLRKVNLEGKPIAVLKLPKKTITMEQNMKEVIGALAKWAIQLKKN